MQTNFGCCIIDGNIVAKNKKPKTADEKTKKKKSKKTIQQTKVEFE